MPTGIYKRQFTAEERFWAKVKKTLFGCWEWQGAIADGYGIFRVAGKNIGAHVFSWKLHNSEPIPKGINVLHECDNRRCVRPSHLWLGTQADNIKDCVAINRHEKGEAHSAAKLTDAIVIKIRSEAKTQSGHTLAKKYNVTYRTIRYLLRGDTWKHLK